MIEEDPLFQELKASSERLSTLRRATITHLLEVGPSPELAAAVQAESVRFVELLNQVTERWREKPAAGGSRPGS